MLTTLSSKPTLQLLQGFHHVVAKLRTSRAVISTRDDVFLLFKRANIQRPFQLIRTILQADMRQQHYARTEHRARISIRRSAFTHHSRRAAVDCFEHRILLTDIRTACCTDAALELYRLGKSKTLKSLRRFGSTSFAVIMSAYHSSVTISG